MTISIEDIDDDLRERLERLRQQSGVSFDQVANHAVRIGLDRLESANRSRRSSSAAARRSSKAPKN